MRILAALLLYVSVLAAAAPQRPANVWLAKYDAALAALNERRFADATKAFEYCWAISQTNTQRGIAANDEGIALSGLGRYQEAAFHLLLETGHSSAEEGLMILREARRAGVPQRVVTHAMLAPVRMSLGQMREAAALGAYIEFVYNGLIGPYKEYTPADYAHAIREIGPKSCILASDMGQKGNPTHPDALVAFFAALRHEGISQADIELMSRTNPARALGLQ